MYSKDDRSFKDPRNESPGDDSSNQNPSEDYNVEVFDRDIVYSTGSNYRWVCLKDMTRGLTRKREHDVCIVDEADDVLLDDASNPALLAESFPIRRSEEILEKIFTSVKEKPDFTEVDEQDLISKLQEMMLKEEAKDRLEWEEQGSQSEFKPEEVKLMVDAAKEALKLEKGKDYILQETLQKTEHGIKKVVKAILVDQNTGFILPNTKKSAYIHEMLEIKEGAERSHPSVTICEVSPLTFFNGYTNLIGVTGSAGGEYEESLYERMYKLETFRVPTNRELQREVMLHLLDEGEDRLAKVEAEIREFSEKRKQPVLVILDSINATNQMHEKFPQAKLIQGIDVKTDAKSILAGGREGTIILSTIAAGRGTDIKLTLESLEAGGLHVIVVNLPARSRTLTQNVGRCSRQGQPGSATVYVGPNDQFKEDYNFSPGILNRFKLEEMFYGYVKANWPELMQVEREYYSGAVYYFGATVEDILKANERVIARRFFWPGKKFTEEECHRYLNMVYQMLLTAWGRMFTDLSMSPDQNAWGKCQKAYNEFVAKIEAWRPRDEKGKPLGLGQFIKVFAQRTHLGEKIYHQLYEDWHEDETIEDFIYRLLEDPWIRLHMDNAGIDTSTKNITSEKINFLPQKHQTAYEKLQITRAEYKRALAKYESDLKIYNRTLEENARRRAGNVANAEERARIRDEIEQADKKMLEEIRAARERADAEQERVRNDYERWRESQKGPDLPFSTTVYADEGPNAKKRPPVTREEVEEAERKAKEKEPDPRVLEEIDYWAETGWCSEELDTSCQGLQPYFRAKEYAEKLRGILNDYENADKGFQEASDAITKSSLQTIEELKKRGGSIKDQDLLILGDKPVEPKEPDYTRIGREDFCDLDIDSLIWALYGDPQKYLDEFHRKYLPKIESSYGGHLPEGYINYLDKQLLDAMKQTARDIQDDRRKRAKKEKLFEGLNEINDGFTNLIGSSLLLLSPETAPFGVAESTYAISDIGEGVLDLISSATGKHVCTRNWNFVRDNVCGGNENTYNVVKSVTALGSIAVSGFQVIRSLKGLLKARQAAKAAADAGKVIEESIEATERAAGEAIEESAAAGSAASTAKNATQASEKLVKVYRGTDIYAENAAYDETGHLMSEATRTFYIENGRNIQEAYSQSESIHSRWIKEFWGSERDYVQAHGEFGTELGEIGKSLDAKKTLMSVTTDLETAKSFAGRRGRVYEAFVPESSLIPQTISDSGESEYLIKFGSEEFKWILGK